uniref:Uncharacterized protein n=1 Tax=Rangifer tarandus platyrhynchus TaxID=3082113 RepID=A0ACB0EM05_RANTA|nr:unnamed protein product [Rangifer tarandus platyrhynchus]
MKSRQQVGSQLPVHKSPEPQLWSPHAASTEAHLTWRQCTATRRHHGEERQLCIRRTARSQPTQQRRPDQPQKRNDSAPSSGAGQ